jgi:hypothetical protein
MDIEKLLKWAIEYLSDYFSVFISTLCKPSARFRPIAQPSEEPHIVLSQENTYTGPALNPRLFGFTIISITIGATLNSVIPSRPDPPDMITTVVITLAIWFAYSLSVFVLCKLVGGKGSFWHTMSVSLQLLAVVYVVSNFVAFIWGAIAQISFVADLLRNNQYSALIVDYPVLLYYPVQFTLMTVYLPIALKPAHHLNLLKQVVAGILPVFWTLWGVIALTGDPTQLIVSPPATPPFTQPPIVAPTVIVTSSPIRPPSVSSTIPATLLQSPTPTPTSVMTPTATRSIMPGGGGGGIVPTRTPSPEP